MDEKFLDKVMGEVEGVGKVDKFVGQLWRGWKQVREMGVLQVGFPALLIMMWENSC